MSANQKRHLERCYSTRGTQQYLLLQIHDIQTGNHTSACQWNSIEFCIQIDTFLSHDLPGEACKNHGFFVLNINF